VIQLEMTDTISEKGTAGFLEIFTRENDGPWRLHEANSNVILNQYRINAANMAVNDDGFYDDSGNLMAEDLIPTRIELDNQGSTISTDGVETIITPSFTGEVDPNDPNYFSHLIDQKDIGPQPNIAVFRIHIKKSEGNAGAPSWSRATLKSISGKSIATKHFESIVKKETWDVYFKWSIAY
jgi:hypothetical protein